MPFDLELNPTDPAELAQLMDEHHLVVLGSSRTQRCGFAAGLIEHLEAMSDTEVIRLGGPRDGSLTGLCRQLAEQLEWPSAPDPSVYSVLDLLRNSAHEPRHQYVVWEDADLLLESDVRLFSRLVNGLFALAAERELIVPDVVVLQRFVFIGGDKLGAYAETASGQFCTWLEQDAHGPPAEVVQVMQRPPVLTYRLDG